MPVDDFVPVIGLEVHTELKTSSKLFCSCKNEFGNSPNTNVCPVCLGLPGSLPTVNKNAVILAVKIGLALNCKVGKSFFARKNYFYPDMPKNYQISQYEDPICKDGYLVLPNGTTIGIVRAHLEEDTGKSVHQSESGRINDSYATRLDFNRSGIPLVEIVSAPEIKTSKEAKNYVEELRQILVSIGASDGKMEEGSLRVDANVSVKRIGSEKFGTRCEIKNLNSLRSLVRAIDYEISRQVEIIESGGQVKQQTRHFNEELGKTVLLREKEEADEYRYFPDPDLLPVEITEELLEQARENFPILPKERRERLADFLSAEDASRLVEIGFDEIFLAAIEKGADAKILANRLLNEGAANIQATLKISSSELAALTNLESSGELSATQSKQVIAKLQERPRSVTEVIKELGIEKISNSEIEKVIAELFEQFPDETNQLRSGNEKLTQFFIGKVMAATKGKANGKTTAILIKKLLS